jgi:uncharacterized HAD superfamily protein
MKVALDLDSTLYPLLDAMRLHPGGERVSYADVRGWEHLPELCDGGVPGMLQLFRAAMSYDTQMQVGLFDGAADAVRQLHADGADIHVMTARPADLHDDTERFLAAHQVPFVTLDCYDPMDKLGLCDRYGVDVIVDDHPDLLRDAVTAGKRALTLRWNYNAAVVDELSIPHATDWEALLQLIRGALAPAGA